jgi:LCP family protein required for cell wall assembly
VVLAVVGLVAVPVYAWSQVRRVDADPGRGRPPEQPGTTFLLVGSDSRAGLTKAERKRLGTGGAGGQRTDTIMLLSVPPGGKPALVSLPRDSYVEIPGNGANKINAAYAIGGPQLLVQTVEQNTGVRVDGYLEVGFGGFVNVIDALGGIRMCIPRAISDEKAHLKLSEGCQRLEGAEALGYVRMRYADPKGDLGRVERQRQMLAAVAAKGASASTLVNPVRYWQLCTTAADALRLGKATSAWEMVRLALAMRKVSANQGHTLTVPVSGTAVPTPVGSAVQWDAERSQALFEDLARADTSDLDRYTS